MGLVVAATGLVAATVAYAPGAAARTCYKHEKAWSQTLTIEVKCPGVDGGRNSPTPAGAPSGCPTAPGNKCQTAQGAWFSQYGCYAHPNPTQPAPGAPIWGGHTKKDGSIYVCASAPGTAPLLSTPFFVPRGAAPARIVTAAMVWRLVKHLTWPKADLNIQPSHG